jgi:hypothetical protein
MPLAIAIEKIGEADIPNAPRTFDFTVYADQTEVPSVPAELDFVHGHFWKTTEADRLRGPTFERHKSGFEVASSDLVVDVAKAIDLEYGYEYILIGDETNPHASPALPFVTLAGATIANWMDAHHRATTAPIDRVALIRAALDAPTLTQTAFTPAGAAAPTPEPFFTAKEAAVNRPLRRRNPVVADYLSSRG